MNISASKASALALLPFGYFALTRLKSLRDLGYLIASSLLPALWLLVRLTNLDTATAALCLMLGYIAFISIYEVGYLVNDAWDAKKSEEGRRRLSFRLKWPFIVTFLTVRAAAWIAVGYYTGWIDNSIWLGGYAALAVAFSQHNLVQSRGLRLASFYELAALRFLLPIVAVIPGPGLLDMVVVALVLYGYPRLLSYMDSKAILELNERRMPGFGFLQILSLSPLLLFLAYYAGAPVIAELLAYYLLVYGLWWAALSGNRS